MREMGVMPALGPSGWPQPVFTVTVTFRGFKTASEKMPKGEKSNSAVLENQGLHAASPLLEVTTEVSGVRAQASVPPGLPVTGEH